MKPVLVFGVIISMLFSSCSTEPRTSAEPAGITIHATSAAQPWLTESFVCADELSIILIIDSRNPDIHLRLGEPRILFTPAYQVGEEDILIAAGRGSPIQNLSAGQAQAVFSGEADPTLQVWVFAAHEDVQVAFDQLVMKGRSVTSFARLAASPEQMADVLSADSNAVGILPRHWIMEPLREVYSAGTVPVLAVTEIEPGAEIQELIACLQK